MPRHARVTILMTLCLIALIGCAHQPSSVAFDSPGFFIGLLHGFIMLFSLVGSLFMDIRVYAFPNSGGLYDFGFVLGAMMFFGGGGASASS